ncbi:MAG: hypothetical protein JW801_14745 [Bacteroidales bacterium]|nr:hypothetical protein [Bacteroidales bacterium]
MKNILSILLAIVCLTANGQNIKKGYRFLEKDPPDFEKALDVFKKDLAGNPGNVAANFGVALVYADDRSPVFNIIDAWQYIESMQGKEDQLSQEDIEILSEYFMNTEVRKTSRPVKKKMAIAMEAIEARLIKFIREENNLEAVYEVLDRYPDFRHYDNVIHIRNQFEYRKYEKLNTRAAYDEFITKFPDAAQVPKAVKNINRLAFQEVKSQNSVEGYSDYIRRYPQSEYLQTAIKLRNAAAYARAKQVNTLNAYEDFIADYPDALEISEAKTRQRELLYEQAKRIKSLEAFNQFIDKYPDGQYFVDIFNLKASELGTLFLRENSLTNPAIMWARGFDNNARLESGGVVCEMPSGDYILACNTQLDEQSFSDAWIIKIGQDGKMAWNKIIGQAFADSVTHVLIDNSNDIIVLGYTYLTADSTSRMGWMFKLGSDGKKIWNKNLGKIEFTACAIDQQNRIYLGGYQERDSLGAFYAVTTFNTDAKMLGEKVYTGKGSINDIAISPNGDIFLCGSNWIMLMEPRRYIKWDHAIDTSLTATSCAFSPSGDVFLAGYNKKKIFYARYSADGKKIWLKDYVKADSTQVIKDILLSPENTMLTLEQTGSSAKIKLFSASGDVTGVKELFGNITLQSVIPAGSGSIMLATDRKTVEVPGGGGEMQKFTDGNLIVIRYSTINSM